MGFFDDDEGWGCCGVIFWLLGLAVIVYVGFRGAEMLGLPHKYIPDALLTDNEILDDAIEVNDFEKATKLVENWSNGFGTKPAAKQKLLRAEYVYLINHNEFLRAENISSQYDEGAEILTEVLNQQKTNIYKKFNDYDDRTLSAICSYMNQYDFMTQYLQNVSDPARIITFLETMPVQGSGQIGSSTDKDVRKANEEYAANVSKYNQVCDLVLSYAINTRNRTLAQQVIQAYKKSIKTVLTETHTFSANEYSFEHDDSAREHAKMLYKNNF